MTMRTIMMAVALMAVTVVELMSLLLTAPNANAWEKHSQAQLYRDLFVLAQWKISLAVVY